MIARRQSGLGRWVVAVLAGFQALLWSGLAAAQAEIQVEIDGDRGGAWYATWWIWVLVALFIIVIVALTSRGRAKES
ncbi:MAG: hypothetical protein ACRENB_08135 [Gemmatimonadales bacterium]